MSNPFLPPPSSLDLRTRRMNRSSVLKAKSRPACPRGLKYNAARIRALEPMTEVRKRADGLAVSGRGRYAGSPKKVTESKEAMIVVLSGEGYRVSSVDPTTFRIRKELTFSYRVTTSPPPPPESYPYDSRHLGNVECFFRPTMMDGIPDHDGGFKVELSIANIQNYDL
ncbi:uncharacterized protein RSE6_13574 [Rhynchosporium secalis]|uniref:Uncharacterized protein n=1 Tax=Rhynchosporium secalis TaxID=38038 RepID=A0A1E1MT70_RHYSE|nr:uncharacterized protein RSE6_13574 [Rhynchosporium secalis]